MTENDTQVVVTSPAEDPAPYFEIDPFTSVNLRCPECYEVLWLLAEECPTLADVIAAANKHECYPEDES